MATGVTSSVIFTSASSNLIIEYMQKRQPIFRLPFFCAYWSIKYIDEARLTAYEAALLAMKRTSGNEAKP